MAKQVKLVYPLYLDVPMMTSFLAAIEDGVAYGSDVVEMNREQKDRAAEAGGGTSIPGVGILSSVLSFDLRGKISGKTTVGNREEVRLVRKHTESSLFIKLRQELRRRNIVENLDHLQDMKKLQKLKGTSLVK